MRRGEDVSVEILNYRKDGTPFWNALHVSPVRDGAGEVRYFFGSQHDVSANKRLEQQLQDANARLEQEVERRTRDLRDALKAKEVLLHEVDHRVKNNLQLVGSLLAVQARRIPDPAVRATLQRAVERVGALSTVHQRLYEAAALDRFDLTGFARQLAEDLVAASGRSEVNIELELDPLVVPAEEGRPARPDPERAPGQRAAPRLPGGPGRDRPRRPAARRRPLHPRGRGRRRRLPAAAARRRLRRHPDPLARPPARRRPDLAGGRARHARAARAAATRGRRPPCHGLTETRCGS